MAKARKQQAGTWHYVPTEDRALPAEEQTRLVLRPLTGAERERAVDDMSHIVIEPDGTRHAIARRRSVARQLALTHIDAIENFPPDGAPQPWPKALEDRVRYLEQLDDDLVFEIGNEIYNRSALGPEDEKKVVGESSAPARTSSSPGA